MTVPFLCVLFAWLLVWVPRVLVAVGQARAPGGFDNRNPRDQQARLEGWARRASAAHANAFEAFGPFAAAVFVAHLAHAPAGPSAALAVTFVAARAAYPFLYVADRATARSAVWSVGALATLGLFVAGYL